MNVLDENIPRDQADLLRQWNVRFRSISQDLGYRGITDQDIVPLLLRLKRPTLLTRDRDFWDSQLVHSRYAIVWIDALVEETAFWIKRFMTHPQFRTSAQRLGKVVRVHPSAIDYWRKNADTPTVVEWL